MKPKFIYILMTIIVMGMVIPAFAGSPDKKPGDNTKKENPVASPAPLTDWTFNIIVSDPNDNCCAYTTCTLQFNIQAATEHCEGLLTDPEFQPITIVQGQKSYQGPTVPGDIPCVMVNIIVDPGCTCTPLPIINSNTCCICRGDTDCILRICP
jgi:hypothetical protein